MDIELFLKDLSNLTSSLGPCICKLGEGGEGIVNLHELVEDDQHKRVAVKTVRQDNDNSIEKIHSLRNEALILQNISHPNIVSYFGSVADDKSYSIVLEYCINKSLAEFAHPGAFPYYDNYHDLELSWVWSLKKQFCSEIADGLSYLHENEVFHLDLKPSNILVDQHLHAKISDFGCAISVKDSIRNNLDRMTYSYAAPEWISCQPGFVPDEKCDVFSFGILIWEVIAEKPPYIGAPHCHGFYKVAIADQQQRPCLTSIKNEGMKTTIQHCWDPDPNVRPTSSELKSILMHQMNHRHSKEATQYYKQQLTKSSTVKSNLLRGSYVSEVASISDTTVQSYRPDTTYFTEASDEDEIVLFSNDQNQLLPKVKTQSNVFLCNSKRVLFKWQVLFVLIVSGLFIGTVITLVQIPSYRHKQPNLEPRCSRLNISKALINCSKSNLVGSVCSVQCMNGYNMMGPTSILCNPSFTWSAKPPVCEKNCSSCNVGKDCSLSISWTQISRRMFSETGLPYTPILINYGEHAMMCRCYIHIIHIITISYACKCVDQTTGLIVKCRDFLSISNSLRTTAGHLISKMIDEGVYPKSCDALHVQEYPCSAHYEY